MTRVSVCAVSTELSVPRQNSASLIEAINFSAVHCFNEGYSQKERKKKRRLERVCVNEHVTEQAGCHKLWMADARAGIFKQTCLTSWLLLFHHSEGLPASFTACHELRLSHSPHVWVPFWRGAAVPFFSYDALYCLNAELFSGPKI